MKRIITFAIMALMIGGFTIYANAQPAVKKDGESSTQQGQSSTQQGQSSTQNSNSSNKPGKTKGGQQQSTTQNWTPIINDWLSTFERLIVTCESINANLQKVEKQLSMLEEKDQRKASQRKTNSRRQQGTIRVDGLESNLSEAESTLLAKKKNLENDYKTKYDKAKGLKTDISKNQNNVTDARTRKSNSRQFDALTARFDALPKPAN